MKVTIFQFSLFGINTYVVSDPATGDCAVIDPGMINREEREALSNFIRTNNLHLKYVINTHLHIDHAIGNSYVRAEYGVPTLSHPDDAKLGQRLRHQAIAFGMDEKDVENVEASEPIHDGEIIRIGEGELKAIHVPGHSPGSIVLYDEKDGFLIGGDVLFEGSIGRTDLPGGSYETLIRSIREKLLTLPPSTVVYPGHGPATTIGREMRSNPFLR